MMNRRRMMMLQQKVNRKRTELEVNKADVKLMIWNNTWYTTATNETVIVGYYDAYDGVTYPLVIGATRASALVHQRYVGSSVAESFYYNDTILFRNIADARYTMATTVNFQTELPFFLHLNTVTGVEKYGAAEQTVMAAREQAAKDLLDYYLGKI